MNGISGFNFENKSLLKKMLNLIKHRGLEDEGYYTDSKVSLGIRMSNLKKNQLQNQPLHSEDETIWLICDGEIYNSLEIRKELETKGHNFYTELNAEVIIHSYEEWSEGCLNKFRGVFCFCIYDKNNNILFLARDHIGIKTLYYSYFEDKFIFGSELKTLLCHDIKKYINKSAYNFYLSLGYVPNEDTLINSINKVPSSSYLIFNLKTKEINVNRYWDFIFNINNTKTEDQSANELKNLIFESINIRLVDGLPIGAFLSGGIDSSAVVGALSKLIDKPITTYSIGFEEGAPVNETRYAKFVSEYFNTEHNELIFDLDFYEDLPKIIWHNDDLFADAAIIPVYFMGKYAKKNLDLIFTGDGADEVFAGYSNRYRAQKLKFFKFFPKQILNTSMKFYNILPFSRLRILLTYLEQSNTLEDRYIRNLFDAIYDREKLKAVPFEAENIKSIIKSTFKENLDIVNQFTYWDLKYQLPNLYNVKADRAISAASLTGRIPLLDRDLVAWSLTIPSELKLKGTIEKYILRMAIKDFVPREVLKRKKLGFGTPINFWLNSELKNLSKDLLENLSKRKDLIKSNYVKKIIKNRVKKLYEFRTWNLMMFELWYETFFENDGLKPISV